MLINSYLWIWQCFDISVNRAILSLIGWGVAPRCRAHVETSGDQDAHTGMPPATAYAMSQGASAIISESEMGSDIVFACSHCAASR